MKISTPKIFQKRIVVKEPHLDEMHHVNNVQYLQWIQDVAKDHWQEVSKEEWNSIYAWVALNHFIEYKKPAFLNDELLIQTHVHEFSGPKSNRLVRISNEKTGELIVQSSTWWCMISRETNKPARVFQEILERFNNNS